MSNEHDAAHVEKWAKYLGLPVLIGACAVGWGYDLCGRAPERIQSHMGIELPASSFDLTVDSFIPPQDIAKD